MLLHVENENVTLDNITSLNIPSSSNTAFNKKRKLNECEAKEKQLKDEKLKSNTVKVETSKHNISIIIYKNIFYIFITILQNYIPDDEPFLRLCLRLPNGTKETISMCATDTIEVCSQNICLILKNYAMYKKMCII